MPGDSTHRETTLWRAVRGWTPVREGQRPRQNPALPAPGSRTPGLQHCEGHISVVWATQPVAFGYVAWATHAPRTVRTAGARREAWKEGAPPCQHRARRKYTALLGVAQFAVTWSSGPGKREEFPTRHCGTVLSPGLQGPTESTLWRALPVTNSETQSLSKTVFGNLRDFPARVMAEMMRIIGKGPTGPSGSTRERVEKPEDLPHTAARAEPLCPSRGAGGCCPLPGIPARA